MQIRIQVQAYHITRLPGARDGDLTVPARTMDALACAEALNAGCTNPGPYGNAQAQSYRMPRGPRYGYAAAAKFGVGTDLESDPIHGDVDRKEKVEIDPPRGGGRGDVAGRFENGARAVERTAPVGLGES